MNKVFITALALITMVTTASAADLATKKHVVRRVVEAPLVVQAPLVDPVIVAVPFAALTAPPVFTRPVGLFPDPIEFGFQFVPRVKFGVGSIGEYR